MTDRPDDRTARIDGDGDDATRRIDPRDDATQAMRPEDDATRPLSGSGDATQMIGATHVHEPAVTHRFDEPIASPATRTERIAVPARGPALGPWLIAALVVIALIAGGILGYSQTEPADGNVVSRALVGPSGGVLTFDQVGRLEVPSGALPTATAITVRREKLDRRVRLGTAEDPRSRVYDAGELDVYVFEPADLRFQQPVKITLPRQGDAQAVLVDAEEGARVLPAKGNAATVEVETTSFSFGP